MSTATRELIDAAKAVVDSWEQGDLAGAVNALAAAAAEAEAEELEPAVIKRGKLVCSKCGPVAPRLIEHGYYVTHSLLKLAKKEIEAEGWDGTSHNVSESGTHYALECPKCFGQYALPEGLGVDWQ